jgi:hypothetical protein
MSTSLASDITLRDLSRAVWMWIAAAGTVPLSVLCAETRVGSAEILAATGDPDLRSLIEVLAPVGIGPAAAPPESVFLRQRLHSDSLHIDQIRLLRSPQPRRIHSGSIPGQPP